MRASAIFCVFLTVGAFPSPSQQVQVVPDIAIAEAEYRDAQEASVHNDPNLEKDLFKADPEQIRRRIRRAASLSDDAMVKKGAYLDAIVLRFKDVRTRLGQSDNAKIPTAALRKDLEAQQGSTLDEEERLNGLLHDLPEGDEYLLVRRALEDELATLVNLQNNIALRIRSLDTIDKSQQAIQDSASGATLAQKLDDVIKLWGQEKDATIRQRTHWANLYTTMEQAVDKKDSSPAPQGAPRKGGGKEPHGQTTSVSPSGSSPASRGVPGLAGTWAYRSQPGAWTGYGEPEMVTLQLYEESGTLHGTYAARLPVRSGVHEIRLSLEGPPQPGNVVRLHWTSQVPAAEGEMEMKLSPDGRLLVERSQSGDAFIPRGMEVLLPQQSISDARP
jgi:hypothetical protein